jgi:aquaporin Z
MVSACVFAILLNHPDSPAARAIESATMRRLLTGLAMGGTAVALIYSPLGQRSGAHMNPAVTLAFWRLGRIEAADALFYVLAQFIGGIAGVLLVTVLGSGAVAHAQVNYVTTMPGLSGPTGLALAWFAEFAIAFILMLVVLWASNRRSTTRYTGLFAGALVAIFIFIEAPISGMSMNPARTFGSALVARDWNALWIYFTAPPAAMLAAAAVYVRVAGIERVFCAKLHHCNSRRCIFKCRFERLQSENGRQRRSASAIADPTSLRRSVASSLPR